MAHDFGGSHSELAFGLRMMEDHVGLVNSESMDLSNDPRFFQASNLDKRLQALSGLSVVSGLMVGTCSEVISMKKDINFVTFEGITQFVAFTLMSVTLFLNILATYVGVAQIYHSYRLETSGPTGFEMAASYYLNPNICAWRHLSVKAMLTGLAVFMIATGMRVAVNFERNIQKSEFPNKVTTHVLAAAFGGGYILAGVLVYWVHKQHHTVFTENYESVRNREGPYLRHVQTMMTSRSQNKRGGGLDV
ncbi:unnamed protein product [Polarella glacialis]|uniref:Uncharacterized protein n=1 Tax=Polarella glacialis TaxID=89957 RepID=A0A813EEL8_POLGL|nr:unnamed protein product [Polarella glacialis]CAE8685603.1 unnamed protein product [Polarella glacialis]